MLQVAQKGQTRSLEEPTEVAGERRAQRVLVTVSQYQVKCQNQHTHGNAGL
jgi:hypothetical protein